MLSRLQPLTQATRRLPQTLLPWRKLTTLAIETSCDDTSVAVLEKHDRPGALSQPQATLHFHKRITANNAAYRGIHPIASLDSHERNLSALVREAITYLPARDLPEQDGDAKAGAWHIPDFVSVTRGPGMRSSLNAGLNTAKGLAVAWGVPLLGVHHMQAHALTPRLVSALASTTTSTRDIFEEDAPRSESKDGSKSPEFPFLTLLVSGGHTMLLSSQSLTAHPILADTVDIALGDCIDKIARHVLPEEILAASSSPSYGPLLEAFAFPNLAQLQPSSVSAKPHAYEPPATRAAELARQITPYGWSFLPPLSTSSSSSRHREMSFTGLVSAVKRESDRRIAEGGFDEHERRLMAQETMRVAFEHVAGRVIMALGGTTPKSREDLPTQGQESRRTLVVSGGVAANKFLKTV